MGLESTGFSGSHRTGYRFTHLVDHLRQGGMGQELFGLIEDTEFLAAQALQLKGFQQGTQDLELYVLPEAIERCDWERFLRHALVAINFRGLAEALSDDQILAALVRRGHQELATSFVDQLADPQRRARARAVMLGASSAEEADGAPAGTLDPPSVPPYDKGGRPRPTPAKRDAELHHLRAELDAVPPPGDERAAAAWLGTLAAVARQLPPALLRDRWSEWIGRFPQSSPLCIPAAWQAVAESWIAHDFGPDPGLWQALGAVGDPHQVRQLLSRRLASPSALDAAFLEAPLPPPFAGDEELLWYLRLGVLGRRLESGEAAVEEVQTTLAAMPAAASAELVDAGRKIWPRLGNRRLAELENRIAGPTVRSALRVVVLEEEPSAEHGLEARRRLAAVPQGPAWFHWTLRYLAAARPKPSQEISEDLRRLIRYLVRVRYRADAADLVRFLDLVGSHLPSRLSRQVRNVVWAPAHGPETLRALAAGVGRTVAEDLLEHAESYADAISASESEGFALRRDVLILLYRRFCCEWGQLERLEEVPERLLPAEEDQLRSEVVEVLAAGSAGVAPRGPIADLVAGIRSPRLRLLSALRATVEPGALDELLEPRSLYRAAVRTSSVEDELHALSPLLELPRDPPSQIRQHLDQVTEDGRRIFGLVDLARHTLAFRRRIYPPEQHDAIAVLQPLAQAVDGLSSDRLRLALTPELVELGAEVGPTRAGAELREAFVRLLELESVPWERRREVLASLLSRIAPLMLTGPEGAAARPSARRRAVARLFVWLIRRAAAPGDDEMRRRWQGLLPLVWAAARPLPDTIRRRLPIPAGGQMPPDREDPATAVQAATALIESHGCDPLDPSQTPLRRALWKTERAESLRALGLAILSDLSRHGPSASEDGLRLWLNAALRPRFGQADPAARKRRDQALTAIRQAHCPAPRERVAEDDERAGAEPGRQDPPEGAIDPSAIRANRTLDVYQRYLQARQRAPRSPLLEHPPRLALMIASGLASLFIFVDFALWPSLRGTPSPDAPGPLPGWTSALLLLALFLVNGVLIDRYLAWTTQHAAAVRGWVRLLRFTAAGLPMVGLWMVVLWRLIDGRQFEWAFHRSPATDGAGSSGRAIFPLWGGGRGSSGSADSIYFLTLFNWGVSILLAGSLLLTAHELESLLGVALLAAAMHLTGFGLSLYALRHEARRTRLSRPGRWLMSSLSLFWLVPLPFLAIAGALLLALSELYVLALRKAPRGLVYRAFEKGDDLVRRLPSRLGLTRDLRAVLPSLPFWQRRGSWVQELERPKDRGRAASSTLWLYRGKVFFLAFDAALLVVLAQRAAEGRPAAHLVVRWLLETGGSLALGLGLFGLLGALLIRLVRPLREPLADLVQPLRYLGLSQLILAASLRAGEALVGEDPDRVGTVLVAGSFAGFLITAVARLKGMLPAQPDEAERDDIYVGSWMLIFIGLVLVGSLLLESRNAGAYLGLVEIPVRWFPVLGMLVSSLLLKRFLQPFRPGQILSTRLPASLRGCLAALVVAAVLPLGGLALPVLVAYRHRRWPEIERWWIDQQISRCRPQGREPTG